MAVVRGTVKEWHFEEGWGVLVAPGLPDTWVHYAFLDMPGYRTLRAGEQVEFDWEPAQQDGYSARATWVRKI